MLGLPTLKEFVDAISVGWSVALIALIGSAAMLFAHHAGLPYAREINGFVMSLFFVVAVFAAAVCMVQFILAAFRGGRWIVSAWRGYRFRQHQSKWLNELPENEKYILSYFFTGNRQAFPALLGHGRLVGLVQKGLVIPMENQAANQLEWLHTIPDHIWEEMKKQPQKFTLPNFAHANYPLGIM